MRKTVPIDEVKENPDNPRTISEHKFNQLVQSIKDFPEMLEKRPLVVDTDGVVLGGNMRLKAAKAAGLTEITVDSAEGWSEKQKREFIIKDNVGFGEWDWDNLADNWELEELKAWGLDVTAIDDGESGEDDKYTKKINSPVYEPMNEKPSVDELYDAGKTNKLITEINAADIDPEEKQFLIAAARRHVVFDYQKIADYYAHSSPEVQELMENSALVIIDFDKAIEQGYIQLTQNITNFYVEEHGDEEQ